MSSNPNKALDTTATWSVVDGTGSATISANGLLNPVLPGTVVVKATTNDGSNLSEEKTITIYDVATSVDVKGAGNAMVITTNGGSLQMNASVSPATAIQTVVWSIDAIDADTATISTNGMLSAIRNGTVNVTATTTDGSSLSGNQNISISNQRVKPTALIIVDAVINSNDLAVQLSIASSTPLDADKTVSWSIISDDNDTASITSQGLLTPIRNGTITVKATSTVTGATDISTTKEISISGQVIEPVSINITSASTIETKNGTIDLTANVNPTDAADKSLTWSISSNDADTVSLSGTTLTAIRNGKVTVRATANQNNAIIAEQEITISNQTSELQNISISGNDIASNAGTSQMTTVLTPNDAENVAIVWSLSTAADSALATISANGLLEAFANGSITVIATDVNTGITTTKTLAISGQILVSEIKLSTENNATEITASGGKLQVLAQVLPANARIKTFSWSIVKAGGNASISKQGLVTALTNGTVYAKASALDNSGISDSIMITISGQVPVESVSIVHDSARISVNNGTLRLAVNVEPYNASDTTLIWIIESPDADSASIDAESGLIKAIRNGTIRVRATAKVNTNLFDEAVVVITNQVIEPTTLTLSSSGNATSIDVNDGTLAISATANPSDALSSVEWGIANGKTDIASINSDGLVTAFRNGVIFVQATSTLAPTISSRFELSITNQIVEPTEIEISPENNSNTINVNDGSLALSVTVEPFDAVNSVTWSIASQDADTAIISSDGIVTALRNGKVIVNAISTADTTVSATFEVAITDQVIEPTAISILGADSISTIDVNNGTLALLINTTPIDAVKTVKWSLASNNSDTASIDSNGIVTSLLNGTVSIQATSSVDSTVVDTFEVSITNQIIEPLAISVIGNDSISEITTMSGTLQMLALVLPLEADASVTWSIDTDDLAIATISETGLLTAKANGNVTVKAISNLVDSVKGETQITISGQMTTILVSAIEISSEGSVTDIYVDSTLQLYATINPDNAANNSVNWSVSNENIASVSSKGLVTALTEGNVTVTASATDGGEAFGTFDVSISIQLVQADFSADNIQVYPNPVENMLYISNSHKITCIEMYDINGQIILTKQINLYDQISINTELLASGIYFVKVHTQNKIVGFKLVK
ncbi:MAG: Ig-like domain-containing protein [Salinivirgaceae bacterium]|nr:Ig-like domain-containing protein [Salinivirgaceae bacterium]